MRRLAIALAVVVIAAGAVLLLRGGIGSGSQIVRNGPERSRADPSVELQKPGDTGPRSLPAPAKPPDSRTDASAPTKIAGLVVDDATGATIDAFEILCTPAGSERHLVDTILGMESATEAASVPFIDVRGQFSILILDGETQSLCAFARGYERSEPVEAKPGAELEIRLKRGGSVHGRVVDPSTGNPVEGALVGWIDRQGKARTGPRERFERTDALGRFAIRSVPFSARAVLAGREDLGEGMSERLELSPETPEREVLIELQR